MEKENGFCHECLRRNIELVECRDNGKGGRERYQGRRIPDFQNRENGVIPTTIVWKVCEEADPINDCLARRCGLVKGGLHIKGKFDIFSK